MNNPPVFDGHNDVLIALFLPEYSRGRTFFEESGIGHIDLPRAKKGGFAGGFFAICTPPPKSSPERNPFFGFTLTNKGYESSDRKALDYKYANEFTNAILDFALKLENQSEGKLKIVRKTIEFELCLANNILAMVLHMEGAEAIKEDLSDLLIFYQRGIRSIGLVWSRPNVFGYGVPYRHPHSPDTGPGLTMAGKNLVAACNEMGIITDLAHLNEKGFYDAAKLSKHPLVVSHSAVHALCPSTRNLTDRQIDIIGESGGVIGIWFEPVHIKYRTSNDGNPIENVSLSELIRHFDYIANRIGIDHVALGSDFDGANMPHDLRDVSYLPNLLNAFRESGYNEDSIAKISYLNWLRVIKQTWE
jgi:membrane dipeptidase